MARIAERCSAGTTRPTRYASWRRASRDAWQHEFVEPMAGSPRTPRPTSCGRSPSIWFRAELRPAVADRSSTLVREADTHLGTGFLATPDLLPVLADAGHLDVAYELLRSGHAPSWLTMIDRGATTIWERWDGIDADGVAHESLNHYSKGAVISFLHRYVAGLAPVEPAYRSFRVQPRPGGGITWAAGRARVALRPDRGPLVARERPVRPVRLGPARHHRRRPFFPTARPTRWRPASTT